ncbi:rhotekin-2 isoform X2 [Mastomys coucha]|uniref:rhotekin-2 isoform X2 n=1 Tax=Mastomys coucha TaxID=35658 RepID=UPI001261DD1E|nr:rhotekin-2 isoform X2 [Mastomys coucha]
MEGPLLRGLAAQQDCSLREKIDLEIRMREGIWKLLSLSTKKDQVLHAVKNLMVCSARIQAYTAELQKTEEEIANQTGRRDSSFESKEREACRGKIALSDIRIPLMWKDSDHFSNKECTQRFAIFCLFRMGAQVFDTDMMIVDQTITDICFENVTVFEAGPDFQLKIEVYSCSAEESSITNTPRKLAKKLKTSISRATGRKISAALQDENPEACLLVSSETRIQALEKESKKMHCFSALNVVAGRAVSHVFAADSLADFQEWMGAFRQHFFDLSQWKHCCEELMRIEIMSPRKPPLFLAKEAASVYHDMSIDSPVKLESVTDIIQKKIRETNGQSLIGRDDESTAPPWAAVFDGSHEMVIQKKVLSPTGKPAPDGKRKKRRAPLPPTDQPPFSIKTQGKENQSEDSRAQVSVSGASPSDPKLSPPTHHLQKPVAAPRKLLPARKNSSADIEHTDTKTSSDAKPVPVPRQKSIRDILDPRSWLQAQV